MDDSTTYNKRRRLARKAEDFRLAWKEQAPEDTFGGKSLADLEADIALLGEAVEKVRVHRSNGSAALRVRKEQEADLKKLLLVIANGVRGAEAHGEDSPLYRAMGFVPRSERSSGLTRPGAGEVPAADEEAAA